LFIIDLSKTDFVDFASEERGGYFGGARQQRQD